MITDFSLDGRHWFLNNYSISPLIINQEYLAPSIAHAFHALMAATPKDMVRIVTARTPSEATRMGLKLLREGKVRKDYNEVFYNTMKQLINQKFNKPEFKELLLTTGDQLLLNVNEYSDRYWGVVIELPNYASLDQLGNVSIGPQYVGFNKLGKLIMEVREELKEENHV
jgi:ribA/ribD-fused uncharacterized protein